MSPIIEIAEAAGLVSRQDDEYFSRIVFRPLCLLQSRDEAHARRLTGSRRWQSSAGRQIYMRVHARFIKLPSLSGPSLHLSMPRIRRMS